MRLEASDPRAKYVKKVFVGDNQIERCTVVDTDQGYVERYCREQPDAGVLEAFRTERICGNVRIEWASDMPEWFRRD